MGLYGDIGTQINLVILCSFLWAWVSGYDNNSADNEMCDDKWRRRED